MENVAEKFMKLGIDEAAVISVRDIPFCESLLKLCKKNACGNYMKSWQCPPLIGRFEELRARVLSYNIAVICKNTYKIEDSFDVEGMDSALRCHREKCRVPEAQLHGDFLHLAAGGCRLCKSCAAISGQKCRFPGKATAAPEAYAIDMTALSQRAGMEYGGGENEVSYFDVFLI